MGKLTGACDGVFALVAVTSKELPIESSDTHFHAYRSLLSDFLLRLCIAVTIGIALLAVVEVFSYWHFRSHDSAALDPAFERGVPVTTAAEREYWREFEAASTVTFHPYVLWRAAPFQGQMINIDQDGIRHTAYTDCTGNNLTIWMFGDSALWGTGVSDAETIPSFLAADYQRTGRKVCVVNFGEKGWANTQEVIQLVESLKVAPRKPDFVIFYDGGTEAFTAYQTDRADLPSNYRGFQQYLDKWSSEQRAGFSYIRQSNTSRLLNEIAAKLNTQGAHRSNERNEKTLDTLGSAIFENYDKNMDVVRLLGQQYGFRPIFTWYPNMLVGKKPLTIFEQQMKQKQLAKFPGLQPVYQAAYLKCEQAHRPNLYYLGDLFDGEQNWLYLSIAHVNAEGNRIVADRLFQIVQHSSAASAVEGSKSSSLRQRKTGLHPA